MTSEEAVAAIAAGYEGPWVAKVKSTGQLITPIPQGPTNELGWRYGGAINSDELTDFMPLDWLPMECAPKFKDGKPCPVALFKTDALLDGSERYYIAAYREDSGKWIACGSGPRNS